METQRLKNIIILILALLNLFLLVLLLNFHWQQNSSQQRLSQQIYALYETNGLTLADEEHLSLEETAPQPLSLQRSLEQEAAIAAWLLDEEVPGQHQGGGIYTYTGERGVVSFRSNGAFDYAPAGHAVSSPSEFCELFCENFGYVVTHRDLTVGSGTITAERVVEDTAVYNCTLFFLFDENKLITLSGLCLSTAGSTALEEEAFSAADALVKFLDYTKTSGAVCNAVTGVELVYDFRSAGQTTSLVSVWQVSTDTYKYYVDCFTGTISRA